LECTSTINESFSEQYDSISYYLSKDELEQILINDTDNYYKHFSDLDLAVRNVSNINEYIYKITNSVTDISSEEKNILDKAILIANNKLSKYKSIGFDGYKAANIVWVIGLIENNDYEGGFPHTRNNIIILPKHLIKRNGLVNTLIHEKIHIYQKMYPNDIQNFLEYYNFKKYSFKTDKIRANPDIDNYIYIKDDELYRCEYNDNPNGIMDVKFYPTNKDSFEHPFEFMAYKLENIISQF
jgi:hypothetical protein